MSENTVRLPAGNAGSVGVKDVGHVLIVNDTFNSLYCKAEVGYTGALVVRVSSAEDQMSEEKKTHEGDGIVLELSKTHDPSDIVRITAEFNERFDGAKAVCLPTGTTLTKMPDVQKLVSLLNRVDEHLENLYGSCVPPPADTLRLRGEIVAAIAELQAGAKSAAEWPLAYDHVQLISDSVADDTAAFQAAADKARGCGCGDYEVCDICQGVSGQDVKPDCQQTWRDRPPML